MSFLDGGQAPVARPDNESRSLYVLGSQSFDPMWEEACADAWRTDTYVNVRDACVFLNFVVA